MRWFASLKIRTKILLSSLIFILLLVVMGIQGYISERSATGLFNDFYNDRFIPVRQLNRTMRNILQIRINMLQEIIAEERGDREEVERRIKYSKELKDKNNEIWEEYYNNIQTAEERTKADEYRNLFNINNDISNAFRKAIDDKNTKEAVRLELEWLKSYTPMVKSMDALIGYQQAQAEVLRADQESNATRTVIITLVVTGISILVGALITWIMNRGIGAPIVVAMERIKDIAEGEGDLTKRLQVDSQDEVGMLAEWLNRFIDKIHKIVQEISSNTERVLGSAQKLSEASQSLSAGTEQMSTQSQSIASAATQMSQNFQVISSSVEEMSISVSEVAKKTADASGVAAEANETANNTSAVINELGTSASEIGKVMETIVNIANQTNLLALNASIEAAGAGDAGKGFAVVASEVKELARQSGESSEDIKARITAIQNSASRAVSAIGEISDVISKVNEISGAIASAVEEQSITAKEIAGNINQSAEVAGEVTRNIEGISTAANQGAQDAGVAADLAGDLNELAEKLAKIVGQFKI